MSKRIRVYPYHFRVSAAAEIVAALIDKGYNALRVYPDKNYRPKPDDLVINWGCSTPPKWKNPLNYQYNLINSWSNVKYAVNKIDCFARMRAAKVPCPNATIDQTEAKKWLAEGIEVVGRKLVTGMGGKGIVLMSKLEDFVPCSLYTQYKKKRKEFRVHVFDGKIIDFQEKRKKKGEEQANKKIRTHDNGWVFCREGVILPKDADICISAVKALGLSFGGVDMIWNEKENKSYVLEVNSAPGIEGTTVTKYVDAICSLAK